jgi:hypothetical protein
MREPKGNPETHSVHRTIWRRLRHLRETGDRPVSSERLTEELVGSVESRVRQKIFIGSFHKSGSVLMADIWTRAAERLDLKLWPMHDQSVREPDHWDVCFHWQSDFGDAPAGVKHKGILVIRDPRDVIISGAHYHCKAAESWLHTPDERLGGMTYQQKINSLPSTEDRLLFELEHAGGETVQEMLAAIKKYPSFRIVKFENLITDYDLMEFHKLFSFLGFRGADIPALLSIAFENSIFSGNVPKSGHVRSGRPGQWKTDFSPRVLAAFEAAFGDAPRRLGYEP